MSDQESDLRARRTDHIGRILRQGQRATEGHTDETLALDEAAPSISLWLVEWLRQRFPPPFPKGVTVVGQDGLVEAANRLARFKGICEVIDHLQYLNDEQLARRGGPERTQP